MAQAQNDIERAERDMTELENCLNQSKELAEVTRSPLIAPKDKQAVFGAIMEKMDLCALTANFVHTIIANGRVSALPDIIAAFHAKAQEASGAVGAKITAARQLSQEQKSELTDAIEKTLDKKLLPRFAVDSSLLGGLIVKIGSRQIDTCLKTKLSSMKLKLKEVG